MTNARSDGSRVYIDADDHDMRRVVRAGGFSWAAARRHQGHVVFNTAVGPTVGRLRDCTNANGGTR